MLTQKRGYEQNDQEQKPGDKNVRVGRDYRNDITIA